MTEESKKHIWLAIHEYRAEAAGLYVLGDVGDETAEVVVERFKRVVENVEFAIDRAFRGETHKLTLALRNCLALAQRGLRAPIPNMAWEDIVRFCADAGVVPTVLRTGVDPLRRSEEP